MRRLGLTLASLALLLTACGGSDGDGSDDGSPSADESSQDATTPGDDQSDDAESEDAESDDTESDDAEPTETGSVEDLEAAFTKYTKAFFQGKADKAVEFYTEDCQKQMAPGEFDAAAAAVKDAYAADFKLTITSSDVDGDKGKVEATYGVKEIDEAHAADDYDWVYDDGEWLLGACF